MRCGDDDTRKNTTGGSIKREMLPYDTKKALRNIRERARYAALSPEEKRARSLKRSEKRRERCLRQKLELTPEEIALRRAERARKERERVAKLNPLQKELRRLQHAASERQRRAKMDPDKKESLRLRHAEREKERRKNMDPVTKEFQKMQHALYERQRRQGKAGLPYMQLSPGTTSNIDISIPENDS